MKSQAAASCLWAQQRQESNGGQGESKCLKILWRTVRVSVSLKRGKGASDTEKAILFLLTSCQFSVTLG